MDPFPGVERTNGGYLIERFTLVVRPRPRPERSEVSVPTYSGAHLTHEPSIFDRLPVIGSVSLQMTGLVGLWYFGEGNAPGLQVRS